jgi:hypothetical protein
MRGGAPFILQPPHGRNPGVAREFPLRLVHVLALLILPGVPAWAQAPSGEWVIMVDRVGTRGPPVTGVLLSSDGLAVVPGEAVGQARTVTVHLQGGVDRTAKVLARDDEQGLALLGLGEVSGQPSIRLYAGKPLEKGNVLTVRGVEGGLPWQNAKATVAGTQTGPWGNLTNGYLTMDGESDGTGADLGAAVFAADGTLAGIHVGRLRVEGAPAARFVALTVDRLRIFLATATKGLPVARLCVTADAPLARVFLDGVARGAAPQTLTGLDAGWHALRVEAPGRAPQERIILAAMDADRCQAFWLKPAASIIFTANIPNAQVSVDGAPFVLLTKAPVFLPPGNHVLRFLAKGHRQQAWVGDITTTAQKTEAITLVREHGLFTISSTPPGATVLIEGKKAGVAPLVDLKLAPGRWNVVLELAHYRSTSLGAVDVRDGALVDLGNVTLPPLPGRLTLAGGVVEKGDEVFLNGRRVEGNSWKVEPGYHDIEVRRPWHLPAKLRVHMDPDEARTVAPRPEETGAAKVRRLKILGGVGGVLGAVAAAVAGGALLGGGAAMLAGAKLAYDRYMLQTTQPGLGQFYGAANGLMWGGVVLGASSVLAVVLLGAAVVGSGYAFFTLPSDPSRQTAPAPAPGKTAAGAP